MSNNMRASFEGLRLNLPEDEFRRIEKMEMEKKIRELKRLHVAHAEAEHNRISKSMKNMDGIYDRKFSRHETKPDVEIPETLTLEQAFGPGGNPAPKRGLFSFFRRSAATNEMDSDKNADNLARPLMDDPDAWKKLGEVINALARNRERISVAHLRKKPTPGFGHYLRYACCWGDFSLIVQTLRRNRETIRCEELMHYGSIESLIQTGKPLEKYFSNLSWLEDPENLPQLLAQAVGNRGNCFSICQKILDYHHMSFQGKHFEGSPIIKDSLLHIHHIAEMGAFRDFVSLFRGEGPKIPSALLTDWWIKSTVVGHLYEHDQLESVFETIDWLENPEDLDKILVRVAGQADGRAAFEKAFSTIEKILARHGRHVRFESLLCEAKDGTYKVFLLNKFIMSRGVSGLADFLEKTGQKVSGKLFSAPVEINGAKTSLLDQLEKVDWQREFFNTLEYLAFFEDYGLLKAEILRRRLFADDWSSFQEVLELEEAKLDAPAIDKEFLLGREDRPCLLQWAAEKGFLQELLVFLQDRGEELAVEDLHRKDLNGKCLLDALKNVCIESFENDIWLGRTDLLREIRKALSEDLSENSEEKFAGLIALSAATEVKRARREIAALPLQLV